MCPTNQKILVTGADGFIGSHLDLCCRPWRAVVFDEGGCHLPSDSLLPSVVWFMLSSAICHSAIE